MQKLTKQNALDALETIKRVSNDPEEAHSVEDILHDDFIFCCANELYDSLGEVIEIATIINQSSGIEFPRWKA